MIANSEYIGNLEERNILWYHILDSLLKGHILESLLFCFPNVYLFLSFVPHQVLPFFFKAFHIHTTLSIYTITTLVQSFSGEKPSLNPKPLTPFSSCPHIFHAFLKQIIKITHVMTAAFKFSVALIVNWTKSENEAWHQALSQSSFHLPLKFIHPYSLLGFLNILSI